MKKLSATLHLEGFARGSLDKCHCGVLCLTKENVSSPWIHFEAGGMVKGIGKKRVATILLDLDYGDLAQPLNQFNGLKPDKTGLRHLVKSFHKVSDLPIKDHVLERAFDKFWEEMVDEYQRLFPLHQANKNSKPSIYVIPEPNTEVKSDVLCEPNSISIQTKPNAPSKSGRKRNSDDQTEFNLFEK